MHISRSHFFFQLLDTLPVCQDFSRSRTCPRPTCHLVHLDTGMLSLFDLWSAAAVCRLTSLRSWTIQGRSSDVFHRVHHSFFPSRSRGDNRRESDCVPGRRQGQLLPPILQILSHSGGAASGRRNRTPLQRFVIFPESSVVGERLSAKKLLPDVTKFLLKWTSLL